MDDASFGSGDMGMDPSMGADQGMDPGATGMDPNMGGDPGMGEDPNLGMDPNAGGDQGMGGDPGMDGESFDLNPGGINGPEDGTEDDAEFGYLKSIYSNLSPTDKDALIAYGKSMDARDETNMEAGPENGPDQQMGGAEPMMEVVFTKGQLKKINEEIGPVKDELYNSGDERKELTKKVTKTVSKKSPFNSPRFKQ